MAIGHPLTVTRRVTVTRRAASGSRTDEAAEPPEPADPESGTAAAARTDTPVEAGQPAETPSEPTPDEPAAATEPDDPAGDATDDAPDEPAGEAEPVEAGEPAEEPAETDEAEAAAQTEAVTDDTADADTADEAESAETPVETPVETPAETPVEDAGRVAAPGDRESGLVGSLRRVRAELAGIRFPLPLPGARSAAESARNLAAQLDDYLLPRLARLDAPLLVVVGGSTGAGKSTLVNSLVRTPVSPAGVLRPTTRAPVLVSAPGDARWFLGPAETGPTGAEDPDVYLLPGLTRRTGLHAEPGALRVISAPGLPRGLALLDAPDLDSVVAANRALAEEVQRAADLWLCVTTAARYADALPWTSLRAARDRGTRLALLLNRVPPGAEDEIVAHLGELLDAERLSGTQLFVLPEVVLDGQGLLAEDLVAPVSAWLGELAGDPSTRVRVVGDTLGGALAALRWGVEDLAEAVDQQYAAVNALREIVRRGYAAALSTVDGALADGTVLRGETLARWRQFVDEGGVRAAVQAQEGGLVQRIRARFGSGEPASGKLLAALEAAAVTLIVEAVAEADEQVRTAWSADPAGAALLTASHGGTHALVAPTGRVAAGEARVDQVRALVRDWRSGVRETASGDQIALLIELRVLAGELPLEPREQTRVRGVLGQGAVPTLVEDSRADLLARVRTILDADAAAFTTLLADADDAATTTAERLRTAVSTGEPQ